MKVIKRDGRIVEFDINKIKIAIEKANTAVNTKEQAKANDIKKITDYIVSLDKKRILVEDIQDIIELKLMELKKYQLAKRYIVYRYNRALIRKQNATDDTIIGLIRKNKNGKDAKERINISASMQRDLIAGVVSKDLTKRVLLPEKISNAIDKGIIYFNNKEYFLQPIFNSCSINLKDMLNNNTVMNGKLIEEPKSFQVACNITTQIILNMANAQYGELSFNIKDLSKYLRISKLNIKSKLEKKYQDNIEKELLDSLTNDLVLNDLKQGIQTMQYQFNTLLAINGYSPLVTLFLELDDNDEYISETAQIIEEILNQRYNGLKNENNEKEIIDFPKLIYVLNENNSLNNTKYDYITQLLIECLKKDKNIYLMSSKVMKERNDGLIYPPIGSSLFISPYNKNKEKITGRFNQGIVTLNLPQISIISNTIEEYKTNLEERLNILYDALMRRHYALLNTSVEVSPIHYKYGAISRLKENEKIDDLLKSGYSSLGIGYVGIETSMEMLKEKNLIKNKEEFGIEILKYIRDIIDKWKKNKDLEFNLVQIDDTKISKELLEIDKDIYQVEKYNNYNNYFTNMKNLDEYLNFENKIQQECNGGMEIVIDKKNIKNYEELIKNIYQNILYVKIN